MRSTIARALTIILLMCMCGGYVTCPAHAENISQKVNEAERDAGQTVTTESSSSENDLDGVLQEVDSVEELSEALNEVDGAGLSAEPDVPDGSEDKNEEFALCRLILFADEACESYGAENVIYYSDYDYYVFEFDSEYETEAAYEEMVRVYGEDRCMPDEVIEATDVLADAYTAAATYESVGWGCSYMGMDYLKSEAADYELEDVKVAVIDSGVNSSNALFKNRIDEANSCNVYAMMTGEDDQDDYSDFLGHGSHVAGIIADCTPSNVQLMILKSFSSVGNTSASILCNALIKAIESGADVINMSLCFYGNQADDATRVSFEYLFDMATQMNIVVCAAAGNANAQSDNKIMDVSGNSYPADSSDVITVSALRKNPAYTGTSSVVSTETVVFDSSYSYYGSQVDFSAPGTSIKSAWSTGGYYTTKGTSMATPHITSAVAYVKMVIKNASKAQVVNVLSDYCVDLGDAGKDIYYGYGCPYLENLFADYFPNICNIKSVKNEKNGLSVKWSKVAKASEYMIYRKTGAEDYKLIKTIKGVANDSFTDTSVKSGIEYTYMVKAVRYGVEGAGLSTTSAIRLNQTTVKVKNKSKGVQISWKRVQGAKGYYVYRKTPGASKWKLYKKVSNALSTTDTKVKNGSKYIYSVAAFAGQSVGSYDVSGVTTYRLKGTSQGSVTSKAKRSVTVKWKKSAKVTGYQIEYSTSRKYKKHKIVTVKKAGKVTKTISGLKSKKYYYVRIRTYKKVNGKTYYSDWSATRKVKVK